LEKGKRIREIGVISFFVFCFAIPKNFFSIKIRDFMAYLFLVCALLLKAITSIIEDKDNPIDSKFKKHIC
jgi:hypothetical protein